MAKDNRPATAAPQMSWRDVLPIHPSAEKVRPATAEEQRVLRGDLKKHGQREPVVLVRIGQRCEQLLDGRTRLDLQEANGDRVIDADGNLMVPHRTVELSDDNAAFSYVLSLNVHRRHLDRKERRDLIVQTLKADPTKSNRQIARLTDTSHPYVAEVRKQAERAGDVESVTTSVDTKGRRQVARKPKRSAAAEPVQLRVPVTRSTKQVVAPAYYVHADPAKVAKEPARSAQPRDDIGSTSVGELARLQARVDELQAEVRQRDIKVVGLQSEIEDLKATAPAATASPVPTLQAAIEKLIDEANHVINFMNVLSETAVYRAVELELVVDKLRELNKDMAKRRKALKGKPVAREQAVEREAATANTAEPAATPEVVVTEDGSKVPVASAPEGDADDGLEIPPALRRSVH